MHLLMTHVLRYFLIAVMAWLPVGQVVASCCAPQMAMPQSLMHEASDDVPCDAHQAAAPTGEQADSESADVCQCGCSVSGHASTSLALLPADAGHPAVPVFPSPQFELLPAHGFPLLRPPTTLS